MKTSPVLRAHIESIAFWSTRLPSWELARRVLRGECTPNDLAQPRPAPEMLAPNERRRAPDTVALALEVAAQACLSAKRTPQELSAVFASTHGDLAICDYMCATLAKSPTLTSPTKFHHSVHNAAAGYWTIGAKTHTPYIAISAYEYTFAAGILEAATEVLCDDRPVLYVAYDIEARGPLATMLPSQGLFGVAMVLSNASERGVAKIALQTVGNGDARIKPSRSAAAEVLLGNALVNAIPFFECVADITKH
jgi:hypothetical protein